MASTTSKTGSSVRKGFIYQDHVALRLALELYIRREEFELFTEYRKAKSFDDILIVFPDRIEAYQVKHATDPNDLYTLADFIDSADPRNKRVYFEKFSKSWTAIQQQFPTKQKKLYLHTNHALDAELFEVIEADGSFRGPFIRGHHKLKEDHKRIRNLLEGVTHLTVSEFKEFLSCFRFQIKEPALPELIQHIKADLLDHQLGLSSRDVYQDLRDLIEDFSMNRDGALTRQQLEEIFAKAQQRHLLPQKFEVDRKFFVEREQLQEQLDAALKELDSGYIVVTGPPGSGKSTSLTAYFDSYEQQSKAPVFRYYCFVDINDNYQNKRIEAESLRVNLLSALQERFPAILRRRYDYREEQFLQVLTTLGEHFNSRQQKLIIFLDGLDHAERMESEIRDHLLKALPRSLPPGVLFVVGTRELRSWPLFLRKGETNPAVHISMPLFTPPQTRIYLTGKHELTGLAEEHIRKIHRRSEGLPLYLRYIAEKILETGDAEMTLAHFPQIRDGDINRYHEMLWQEFERQGQGATRYVCSLLACLRFPVLQDDLAELLQELRPHEFEDCFQQIQHLLKDDGPFSEIFHSSFKEFVLSTLTPKRFQTLHQEIAQFLIVRKDNEPRDTDLWFRYAFEYAYRAEDYAYILDTVNREFVDRALLHYQSNQTIENAIFWAIESARETSDLLALSRLAALKTRTQGRVEIHLNRSLLSQALLAMGRENEVVRYSCSLKHNRWLIDASTALQVLKALPEHNKRGLGEKLFSIFLEAFRGKQMKGLDEIVSYAYCLGIYGTSLTHSLKWLSKISLKPGITETLQPYVPHYAPHLEAFLEAIIKHHPDACRRRLKNVKRLFSNQLMRYLLIRLAARYQDRNTLREEIEEYLALFQPASNPELAYYAAFAGFPPDDVTRIAGPVSIPPHTMPEEFFSNDPLFNSYRMIFVVAGYENRHESITHIRKHLQTVQSWWTGYLLYLLHVGESVGVHWAGKVADWFPSAMAAIDRLMRIQRGDGEQEIPKLHQMCWDELVESLFLLTQAVCERYPDRLPKWFAMLKRLQESTLWTTFPEMWYGMKGRHEYNFELNIYDRLSTLPGCRRHILDILQNCATTYARTLTLQGKTRSEHFLRLSAIAVRCGNKNLAEEWLRFAIQSTLIYGVSGDLTLFQLIDIVGMLNSDEPELALSRCADILELIDWMPLVTDGDETKDLPQYLFKEIVKYNPLAALDLLRSYAEDEPRWRMEECLTMFIRDVQADEVEILWALSAVFLYHFSRASAKQDILEFVKTSGHEQCFETCLQRFDRCVRTEVPPKRWSELASPDWHPPNLPESEMESQEEQEGKKSLPHSGDRPGELPFKTHISQFPQPVTFKILEEYCESKGKLLGADLMKKFSDQLIDMGETEKGIECLEFVYANTIATEWPPWKKNQEALAIIAEYDRQRVLPLLVEDAYQVLTEGSRVRFVPASIAFALHSLEDADSLKSLYNEYLHHCQELFEQLPKRDERYQWLKTYSTKEDDWQPTAIHFLIDVLDTPDIVSGHRLLDACWELCLKRPELVLPVFIERLSDVVDVMKDRLLSILYIVSYHAPQILLPYADKLAEHLNVDHFVWKMLLLKLLQNVQQHGTISQQVQQKIESVEFRYSSGISSSTFCLLHVTPSFQFVKFFRERTLKTIQRQIASCSRILELDVESVLAKIEQTLKQIGWTVEEAQVKLKDEWNGYIHAQGYPYVPILTSFEQNVLRIFNQMLDKIIENTGINQEQIEALWHILQPIDPEYTLSDIQPRPQNISPLSVSEKERWLSELNQRQADVIRQNIQEEWTPLYERRILSQKREGYSSIHRAEILLRSCLIKQGVLLSPEQLEEETWKIFSFRKFDTYESVTLEQARDFLLRHQELPLQESLAFSSSLPILTVATNSRLFSGYREVVSLSRYLIEKYELTYRGFDLYDGDECVVKYEVWQEGYDDDPYSRELLSHGTCFLIHKDLLTKIFQDYHVELCQGIFKKRMFFKSKYTPEPTEQEVQTTFAIIHQ